MLKTKKGLDGLAEKWLILNVTEKLGGFFKLIAEM